ncbi:hypothetical protein I5518_17415 [Acinetobacter calcoaceticus]|nr:hypothetical protein [Acinetobacter calcoaceticus]MBJ9705617.1 hypothetical protein [Acinetobacter calcoaceticus]
MLRVARAVVDLAQSDVIQSSHLTEDVSF